jgi:chromosome segregation ATPase
MNDYVTQSDFAGLRDDFHRVVVVLERLEKKVDGHTVKLDAIQAKLEEHDGKLDEHSAKLDEHDRKLDLLDERTRRQGVLHERLESKVDVVIEVLGTKASSQDVTNLRDEVVPRLDALESVVRDIAAH